MTRTHKDDLAQLRQEFAKVNVKDVSSITKWFATHPHLSTNDHAQIADRSAYWIRQLKRKANIKGRTPANLPVPTRKRIITTLVAPANWDTKEWLSQTAKLYSVSEMVRATGVSRRLLYFRFAKHGIKPLGAKAVAPKNPCHTHQWCYEHYVEQGLTQQKCADLAGICQQTFANWLNNFKIPVRRIRDSIAQRLDASIWTKKFLHDLKQQHGVNRVEVYRDYFHVVYNSWFWERYYFDDRVKHGDGRKPFSFLVTPDDAKITKVPATIPEFEDSLDGSQTFPAHICIPRDELYKSTFVEQRIAIHNFVDYLTKRGWIHPKYPQYIIDAEWQKIVNSEGKRFFYEGMFSAYPRQQKEETAGLKLVEHFFGLDELWAAFKHPKRALRLIDALAKRHVKVSLHNMIRVCSTVLPRHKIVKVWDPGVYVWIFRHLRQTGTVLDLHPCFGHKAMACAAAGLKYTTIPTPRFQKALDNGFAEFIGLQYEPYCGQPVDLLINDRDFQGTAFEDADPYISQAKRMLYYVKRADRAVKVSAYKPHSVIPVKTRQANRLPDYLFLI